MEMWKIVEEHALEMLPVLGLELPEQIVTK
jgi:hypothetical protein